MALERSSTQMSPMLHALANVTLWPHPLAFRSGLNHLFTALVSQKHVKSKTTAHLYAGPHSESYTATWGSFLGCLPRSSGALVLPVQTKVKPKPKRKATGYTGRTPPFVPAGGFSFDRLPEDVLFEVYLASARANKDWVNATERPKGLPHCPPDMTGGAFATLMELHSRCKEKDIKNFHLRVRYCRDCFKVLVKKSAEKADAWVMRQMFGGVPIIAMIPEHIIDKVIEWAIWDKNKNLHPKTNKPMDVILPMSDVVGHVFSCSLAEEMFTSFILAKAETEDEYLVGTAKEDAIEYFLAIKSLKGPTDEELINPRAAKAYYITDPPTDRLKNDARMAMNDLVLGWFEEREHALERERLRLEDELRNDPIRGAVGGAMEVDQLTFSDIQQRGGGQLTHPSHSSGWSIL
ncbi:hypothetical protein FRB96_003551 [Tulasnella sp. 330]|nr:hypothetical protein FRB96_003551 [Tulasnella sp. 330]